MGSNQKELIATDNNLSHSDNLTPETLKFVQYLNTLQLPSDNIIAPTEQRLTVMNALPNLLSTIPEEDKRDATYLSKFVAASAIGLFDAALNYVWNEVIINIREKIVFYGLDTFYDNALSEKIRDEYKSERDLPGIKDRTLLDTCKKLEWISDIIYKKLCHILDMRNQIGASHPNFSTINPYELLGWLEVCVKDVINDKPSASAINVRQIIINIKARKIPLDSVTLNSLESSFKDLSTSTASTLLVSLFGIFVADSTDIQVRNNILAISKVLWNYCTDSTKYDLGEKKEYYRNNLETEEEELAYIFFEKCDGLSYLTLNEKSLTLSSLCDDLYDANHGWDNYYNEAPIAREIMKYIKSSSDIPKERSEKIINTFLECRIGREVSYNNGVSPGAKPYYDSFFKLLSIEQIKTLLYLLRNHLDYFSNNSTIRTSNVKSILLLLKSDVIGERLNEILDYLIDFADKNLLHGVYSEKHFKDICRGVIEID